MFSLAAGFAQDGILAWVFLMAALLALCLVVYLITKTWKDPHWPMRIMQKVRKKISERFSKPEETTGKQEEFSEVFGNSWY